MIPCCMTKTHGFSLRIDLDRITETRPAEPSAFNQDSVLTYKNRKVTSQASPAFCWSPLQSFDV